MNLYILNVVLILESPVNLDFFDLFLRDGLNCAAHSSLQFLLRKAKEQEQCCQHSEETVSKCVLLASHVLDCRCTPAYLAWGHY